MRKNSWCATLQPTQTFSSILESRRVFLADQLHEVCRETSHPRILSVANGAVREAETAVDLCRSSGGTFVVLDGTGEPPELFRLDYPNRFARYICYPHGVIPSKENIGEFDYVYTLNLVSELEQRKARAMVAAMFSLVRPGGRLLISNFTHESRELTLGGFLRREEEMADLVPESGEHQVLGHAIWRDESRAILYLEIQKTQTRKTQIWRNDSVSCHCPTRPGLLH